MKTTWKRMMEEYLAGYLSKRRAEGRDTTKVRSVMRMFFRYCEEHEVDAARLGVREAGEFQRYLITLAGEDGSAHYRRGSVLFILAAVSAFYSDLRRERRIPANPFEVMERVRADRKLSRNILTEDETALLLSRLAAFGSARTLDERKALYRAHVLAELMYATGARVSEAAEIRAEDVDFSRGLVRLKDRKGGREREALLNGFASAALKIFIEDMRLVVLFGKNRADMTRVFGAAVNLRMWFNPLLGREALSIGLRRITSHVFRHCLGFHLLRAGCDIRHIQEILGHRALSSTQVYTRVDMRDLKNVLDRFHPRSLSRAGEKDEN